MPPGNASALQLLTHPYQALRPLVGGALELKETARQPGSALVWLLESGATPEDRSLVEKRAGGLSLLVILPQVADLANDPEIFHLLERTRPHGILPFHEAPSERELAQVLRRPPEDLGAAVTDYLQWRGIKIDRETVHLIRRTIDLSAELRSITALSRSMYLSRRALGRRFMSRGLPVPSHWLQAGRLLRVALKLQNCDDNVFAVAYELGYPDGFAVSNQMSRLIGCRPSDVREHLGWEWILESWLRREAESGGLAPGRTDETLLGMPAAGFEAPLKRPSPRTRRSREKLAG